MGPQQFCLKWNNHTSNMLSNFESILSTETFVDVTLACDGLSMKAHKIVLAAGSSYFQSLLGENPCKHPIVIMKDINYKDLKAIVHFMYYGEVNVPQEQLSSLLKTAELLKIQGLTNVQGDSHAVEDLLPQSASTPINDPFNITSIPPSHLQPMPVKHRRIRSRKRSHDSKSDDDTSTEIRSQSPEIVDIVDAAESTSGHFSMLSQQGISHSSMESFSTISHSTDVQDFRSKNVDPSNLLAPPLTIPSNPSNILSHGGVPVESSHDVPKNDGSSMSTSMLLDSTPSPDLFLKHDNRKDVKPVISFEDENLGTSQSTLGHQSLPANSEETAAGKDNNTMISTGPSQDKNFKVQQPKRPHSVGKLVLKRLHPNDQNDNSEITQDRKFQPSAPNEENISKNVLIHAFGLKRVD